LEVQGFHLLDGGVTHPDGTNLSLPLEVQQYRHRFFNGCGLVLPASLVEIDDVGLQALPGNPGGRIERLP
jgi:hypothetical protein